MEEEKSFNAETLKKLEQLTKQLSELIIIQRKAVSGYDYLNANELADLLGESIKTIYARVHLKQIPYYKPGGKILLFKLDEIREWIKSGRHSTMDEHMQNL